MGQIKFLRGTMSAIPEAITDGYIYLAKNTGAVYFDISDQRVRANPPADWNETIQESPAYIRNKPEIGTVASHDVAEGVDLTTNIPTSRQVYNALRERDRILTQLEDNVGSGSPVPAFSVSEMIDNGSIYVYIRDEGEEVEEGMTNWHKYYYRDGVLKDGGVYDSAIINTDSSLLLGGKAADAGATGNRLNEISANVEDLMVAVGKLEEFRDQQEILDESFADDMEVTDSGLVYLLNNNNRIGGPYGPFAGNGGGGYGGGGSYDEIDAKFSATNTTEWNSATISDGDNIYFSFTWESLENDVPSGRGTVTISVNNVQRGSFSVAQGANTINLKSYYTAGTNKIRIRVADQYDQGKSWIVTVNAISLTISSYFSTALPFDDAITFPYTPTGNVSKTIKFIIDSGKASEQVYTTVTSVSGKQLSYVFPPQGHGSHSLDVYFEAEINGETVRSNTLHYEFIAIQQGATDTIIVSPFTDTEQNQYSSVVIPYSAYDPANQETEVRIYVNDILASTQTVDRQQHSFTYKANHVGEVEIKFVCGNTEKIIILHVAESEVHIVAETEALALYLTADGRSSQEATREVWEYTDTRKDPAVTYSATFTDFDWKLNGWMNDDEGVSILRTLGDARVYIPYKPFLTNFDTTGKTFEIEFSTHNVVDYSAPIISCMHDGIGFEITPQTITFNSSQVELMTPFKDNEHIRVTIVVHKQASNRLILFYINGVMSSAVQYPSGDNFGQGVNAAGITIGSNDCGVDIYNMRIYDIDLNSKQVVNNWIADTSDGNLMMERYNRNNIYDNDVINPNTLPNNLPYFIINAVELPQYKGDKKTVTLTFTDPMSPAKSFSASGVQINVQGTSSQAYFRKNYDLQFKKGFNLNTGYSDNYTIIEAIPFNRFVIKADVASSESTNNTRLTMFYNDTCPYKVPEMVQNAKVRWGIEGRPCVVFWYNPDTGITEFLGRHALPK